MPHLVVRQQRLLRIEEFVLDWVVHLLGSESWPLGHRRQQPQQIGAAQRQHHAGRRGRARQVDRADRRVRHRAADEDGVQHARQYEIGDELPLAGQQPAVFAPQQRAPDEAAQFFADHLPASPVAVGS